MARILTLLMVLLIIGCQCPQRHIVQMIPPEANGQCVHFTQSGNLAWGSCVPEHCLKPGFVGLCIAQSNELITPD